MSVGSFPSSGGGGSGSVTSVAFSTGTTGLSVTGSPITTSGTITLAGTLVVANGGTGATDAAGARVNLGSTTVGDSFFTLTNPSAITFPRINADNSVSALSAAAFRSAIGAGTGSGSVTSVDVSGGTTGLTTSGGPVTGSGTITLAGTLGVANGGTGSTTLAANNVLLGNGTSAVQVVAPGTSGNVLTSNGTTWTSAAPSGGTTGWTAALATTTPNDVKYAASFTATGAATDIDAVIRPKGAGALLAQVPDGTATGGNKRGSNAVDLQLARGVAASVASGAYSVVIGGYENKASGGGSAVLAGDTNTASSTYSTVSGGQNNTASGSYTAITSGYNHIASGEYSAIHGGSSGTTRLITGNAVAAPCSVPIATTRGVSQIGRLVLARATTTNTATRLASDSGTAGTTNQVILPNNSAYYFKGKVIATVTGGGNTSAWTFEGAIKRGANAASTAIVGSVIQNLIAQDAGASAWVLAVTADTTNGGLAVTVTGAAATTIRWVCHIETTEVTF